ncbi:ClpX C4-type zinc finger protein [Sorangium sp. So ce363]|uniref:ClpX C4-type zinc finger protein n=1 Tax=Sorangium sp. So ce363 TaxID=3133304 RepID=UPI003F5EA568
MSGVWIELSDRVAASDGVADARSQCSFCRRGVAVLERLIAAADVSICSACVQECGRRLRVRAESGAFWHRAPVRAGAGDLRPRGDAGAETSVIG